MPQTAEPIRWKFARIFHPREPEKGRLDGLFRVDLSAANATACSFAKNAVMIQPRRVLINGAFRTGYGARGSFQENVDERGRRSSVTTKFEIIETGERRTEKGRGREKVVETSSVYFKNVHSIYRKPRIRRARLATRVISRTLDEGRKRETRGERRNKTESGRERERERERESERASERERDGGVLIREKRRLCRALPPPHTTPLHRLSLPRFHHAR